MPNYRYELKQTSGQISAGVIEAESVAAATQILRSQGGYILSLAAVARAKSTGIKNVLTFNMQFGPSTKDVLNFTSQLAG